MAHKSIIIITEDIENFRFNRAVAQLHTLANYISNINIDERGAHEAKKFCVETLAKLIFPMAPHVAEEMWHCLGHKEILANSEWPKANKSLTLSEDVEVAIQVNGKLRDTIKLKRDCPDAFAKTSALATPAVQRHLNGKKPKKIIVIQNRIINVVA